MEEKRKSGFATAGFVLGILGLCTSFIPIINNVSFILALIGAIFTIVSLIKKASKGMAIAGLIICIVTGIIVIQSQQALSNSLNEAITTFNDDVSVDNESPNKITLDKFNQIQTGMTYEEVVAIIGEEGTLSSESSYGDYSSKIYSWSNGIANATISFSNGKVSAKSQFGLGE